MRALFANNLRARETVLHRLDVRTKVFISLLASVAVAILSSPEALLFLCAGSAVYVLALSRLRLVLICYVFVGAMLLLSLGFMELIHSFVPDFPTASLGKMFVPFLRMIVIVNTTLPLALSTRMQTLLTVLKSLRLPVWLYVPVAVMVRFIPTFITDVKQIFESLRTRGYRMTPLLVFRHPLLAVRLLIAPLLFRALRTADELGVAAELKGLGYNKRVSPYKVQHFATRDTVTAGVVSLMFAVSLVIHFYLAGTGGGMHG